ncbi:hypothetical protein SAMN06265222_10924 [Neorhodopirellula lusitana]|uniref:YcxB-like protein domain-containing protein n=1 Tax=Neorhodopirellula lusitana TaxID=445327 RepID=A0ABY1QEG2_9BACT|nr:hypothetical protein [Neorhodopirellula lusitana]SMP65326.1 hypothetical protein SAMN06265222_10924 [Neorhodopirellula lusitana]
MTSSPTNPYQVSSVESAEGTRVEGLGDGSTEVSFRLTKGVLRHAVDHLLLHRHPLRLSIGSLLMIFGSGAAIFWSVSQGTLFFLAVFAVAMLLVTVIYTALVHHSKNIIRKQVAQLGMIRDSVCVVGVDEEELVITTSGGVHRWPGEQVQLYRTPFGIVLCPEPMTPVYVPKKNNSPEEAFRSLRQKLLQWQAQAAA